MGFNVFEIWFRHLHLNRSLVIRGLFISFIIFILMFPFFIKHKENKNSIQYPIEVIESVEQSSKIGKKYTVKIKRIELKESTYILHTDSLYSLNDTIHAVW